MLGMRAKRHGLADLVQAAAGRAGLRSDRAYCSLSQKRFDVSYREIDPMGRAGLLLRTAMASADLRCIGLAERPISRCETGFGITRQAGRVEVITDLGRG